MSLIVDITTDQQNSSLDPEQMGASSCYNLSSGMAAIAEYNTAKSCSTLSTIVTKLVSLQADVPVNKLHVIRLKMKHPLCYKLLLQAFRHALRSSVCSGVDSLIHQTDAAASARHSGRQVSVERLEM